MVVRAVDRHRADAEVNGPALRRWSFRRLFRSACGRYLRAWARALSPAGWKETGLNARRAAVLIAGLPLFFLVQLIHWLGLLLDEVFFRGYRKVEIADALVITGVPRSGTTFIHRTLAASDERFTTMSTWEVLLAPSVTEKRFWRMLGRLDRRLGGWGKLWVERLTRRLSGEFDRVHRVGLWEAEEDYLCLLPAGGCFLFCLVFPGSSWFWSLGNIDPRDKRELLAFYHACLQKHLYVVGTDRRLLTKNASFGTWVTALAEYLPGARFVICVREFDSAYASQLASVAPGIKLLGVERARPLLEARFRDNLKANFRFLDNLPRHVEHQRIDQQQLLSDPDNHLRAVFRFAGVANTQAMKQAAEQTRRHASHVAGAGNTG